MAGLSVGPHQCRCFLALFLLTVSCSNADTTRVVHCVVGMLISMFVACDLGSFMSSEWGVKDNHKAFCWYG